MGQPAAKSGDEIRASDTHVVLLPTSPPQRRRIKHVFRGFLRHNLSRDVRIGKQAAATVDSVADNFPDHIPLPPGVTFEVIPKNEGIITKGSKTVRINNKAAARNGDPARTCEDPANNGAGKVVAGGNVRIG